MGDSRWRFLRQLLALVLLLTLSDGASSSLVTSNSTTNSKNESLYPSEQTSEPTYPINLLREANYENDYVNDQDQENIIQDNQLTFTDRIFGSQRVAFGARKRLLRLAVFADSALVDHLAVLNPDNPLTATHNYIATGISAVEKLMQELTDEEEVTLNIVLVHIGVWSEPSAQPVRKDGIAGVTLLDFCKWASKINSAKGAPGHWHHAILLTGKEVFSTTHETLGSTFLGGACHPEKACSLVEAQSFQSVYIAAHEIAHSLGVPHDGKDTAASCPLTGFIMGEALTEDAYTWSSCSRKAFGQILKESECLGPNTQSGSTSTPTTRVPGDGNPSPSGSIDAELLPARFPELDHTLGGLPGQRYRADAQCQLAFGVDYRAIPSRTDVCEYLTCSNGVLIRGAHPALPGTSCGDNLVCSAGSCTGRISPFTPPGDQPSAPSPPTSTPNIPSPPTNFPSPPPTNFPSPPPTNFPSPPTNFPSPPPTNFPSPPPTNFPSPPPTNFPSPPPTNFPSLPPTNFPSPPPTNFPSPPPTNFPSPPPTNFPSPPPTNFPSPPPTNFPSPPPTNFPSPPPTNFPSPPPTNFPSPPPTNFPSPPTSFPSPPTGFPSPPTTFPFPPTNFPPLFPVPPNNFPLPPGTLFPWPSTPLFPISSNNLYPWSSGNFQPFPIYVQAPFRSQEPDCPTCSDQAMARGAATSALPNATLGLSGSLTPDSTFFHQVMKLPPMLRCVLIPKYLHSQFGCKNFHYDHEKSNNEMSTPIQPQTPGHQFFRNARVFNSESRITNPRLGKTANSPTSASVAVDEGSESQSGARMSHTEDNMQISPELDGLESDIDPTELLALKELDSSVYGEHVKITKAANNIDSLKTTPLESDYLGQSSYSVSSSSESTPLQTESPASQLMESPNNEQQISLENSDILSHFSNKSYENKHHHSEESVINTTTLVSSLPTDVVPSNLNQEMDRDESKQSRESSLHRISGTEGAALNLETLLETEIDDSKHTTGRNTTSKAQQTDEGALSNPGDDNNAVLSIKGLNARDSDLQFTLPKDLLRHLLDPLLHQSAWVENDYLEEAMNNFDAGNERTQESETTNDPRLMYVRSPPILKPILLAATAPTYLRTRRVGPCSRSCGSGSRIVRQICVESSDQEKEVPSRFCNGLPNSMTPYTETCNTFPCQTPAWLVGSWGPCSEWCDVGVQQRLVACAVPLLPSGSPSAAALYLHPRKCLKGKPFAARLCRGPCLQVDCKSPQNKFHPGCIHLLQDSRLEKDHHEIPRNQTAFDVAALNQ